jgi:hypothetical protein
MNLRNLGFDILSCILRFVDFDSLTRLFATFDKRIHLLLSTPRIIQSLDIPTTYKVHVSHVAFLLKNLKEIGGLTTQRNVYLPPSQVSFFSSLSPRSLVIHAGLLNSSTRILFDSRQIEADSPDVQAAMAILSTKTSTISLDLNRLLPNLESLIVNNSHTSIIAPGIKSRPRPGKEAIAFLLSLPSSGLLTTLRCRPFDEQYNIRPKNWEIIVDALPSTLTDLEFGSNICGDFVSLPYLFKRLSRLETLSIHARYDYGNPSSGQLQRLLSVPNEENAENNSPTSITRFCFVCTFTSTEATHLLLEMIHRMMPFLKELEFHGWDVPEGIDLNKFAFCGSKLTEMDSNQSLYASYEPFSPNLTHLELSYIRFNGIVLPRHLTRLIVSYPQGDDLAVWSHTLEEQLPSLTELCYSSWKNAWGKHEDVAAHLPKKLKAFTCDFTSLDLLVRILERWPLLKVKANTPISLAIVANLEWLVKSFTEDSRLEYIDGPKDIINMIYDKFGKRLIAEFVSETNPIIGREIEKWPTKTFRHHQGDGWIKYGLKYPPDIEIISFNILAQIMPQLETIDIDLRVDYELDLSLLPPSLKSLNTHQMTLKRKTIEQWMIPKSLTAFRSQCHLRELEFLLPVTKQFKILDTPFINYPSEYIIGICSPEMIELNVTVACEPSQRTKLAKQFETEFVNHKHFKW